MLTTFGEELRKRIVKRTIVLVLEKEELRSAIQDHIGTFGIELLEYEVNGSDMKNLDREIE